MLVILIVVVLSQGYLPVNLTLPHNTAFYSTDITIPVSWYTIESGRNNIIYCRTHGSAYSASKAILPEGNYTTLTLAQAMAYVMNASYPFGVMLGSTPPVRFVATGNLTSNIIIGFILRIRLRSSLMLRLVL